MQADTPLSAVARVIQLSVAPVFLLTSLGTFLGVLSTRLGRVVDRARILAEQRERTAAVVEELALLARRRRMVNRAITFGTTAALLVCLLVATAFVGSIASFDASKLVAGLFILAMVAFIGSLGTFLAEVLYAVRSTPIAGDGGH